MYVKTNCKKSLLIFQIEPPCVKEEDGWWHEEETAEAREVGEWGWYEGEMMIKAVGAQQDLSEPLVFIILDEVACLSRKVGDKYMEVYEELYKQCGRLQIYV